MIIRTNHLITFVLLIVLLLPFGCGGDDKGNPPEDAFDGTEYTPGPSLVITSGNGEDFTTNETTLTLAGLADDTATFVKIGELSATLTPSDMENLQDWSIDLDLNEGENAFTIKAQDDEGNDGLEKTIIITYDPDYVPDPPENTTVAELYLSMKLNKCYDPAGSRPSEIRGQATFSGTDDGTSFTALASKIISIEMRIGDNYVLTWIRAPVFDHGYKVSVSLYEEDDGFWTGGNDTIGSGEILIGVNQSSATTTIDGNETTVSLGVRNY